MQKINVITEIVQRIFKYSDIQYTSLTLDKQVAQLWQRPRELSDFKKARVNSGTDNDSLKDSHKSLRCRWQTRIIW